SSPSVISRVPECRSGEGWSCISGHLYRGTLHGIYPKKYKFVILKLQSRGFVSAGCRTSSSCHVATLTYFSVSL
ncbi:MAG: hypothetical protein ACREDW_07380, partial [Aestuariivirgaceae bacterium]